MFAVIVVIDILSNQNHEINLIFTKPQFFPHTVSPFFVTTPLSFLGLKGSYVCIILTGCVTTSTLYNSQYVRWLISIKISAYVHIFIHFTVHTYKHILWILKGRSLFASHLSNVAFHFHCKQVLFIVGEVSWFCLSEYVYSLHIICRRTAVK